MFQCRASQSEDNIQCKYILTLTIRVKLSTLLICKGKSMVYSTSLVLLKGNWFINQQDWLCSIDHAFFLGHIFSVPCNIQRVLRNIGTVINISRLIYERAASHIQLICCLCKSVTILLQPNQISNIVHYSSKSSLT